MSTMRCRERTEMAWPIRVLYEQHSLLFASYKSVFMWRSKAEHEFFFFHFQKIPSAVQRGLFKRYSVLNLLCAAGRCIFSYIFFAIASQPLPMWYILCCCNWVACKISACPTHIRNNSQHLMRQPTKKTATVFHHLGSLKHCAVKSFNRPHSVGEHTCCVVHKMLRIRIRRPQPHIPKWVMQGIRVLIKM